MFGYVTPFKPEMKLREYDRYSGYYCAVCHALGRRYGQLPRLTLSYDSVFLALLLDGLNSEKTPLVSFRCGLHPSKKRWTLAENPAVNYAADILLLMAWAKLKDDVQDEKKVSAVLGRTFLKPSYKKLMKNQPEACIITEARLQELSVLEKDRCSSLDRAAEPFAKLTEELFAGGGLALPHQEAFLRQVGYHMGKWVYLIDALDDLQKDMGSGAYNPLLYRFAYDGQEENPEDFRKRISEPMEYNLLQSLSSLSQGCRELDLQQNREIIDNIAYMGLLNRTEQVLGKGKAEHAESV